MRGSLKKNKGAIFPNASMIKTMMELLDSPEGTKPIHLGDEIAPSTEQDNDDDEQELEETNPLDTSDLPKETEDKQSKKGGS